MAGQNEPLRNSPDANLWRVIAEDAQLHEGASVVRAYAEAGQVARGLREFEGIRWWQSDQSGQVFQIEPDDAPAGDARTPSKLDAEEYLKYTSGCNHLAGQPVKPARAATGTIFSRFCRPLGPPNAALSIVPVEGWGWQRVMAGTEPTPFLFDTAELREDGVHGIVGHRKLAFKITPVDTPTSTHMIEQRQAGENAQRTAEQTKPAMIKALRTTARHILELYGADDIVRDKGEGISYRTYGTPDSVTFDFILDGSNISLFLTEGMIDVIMSAAHTSIESAYQEMHGLEVDTAAWLAAVDAQPTFFKEPFEAMRSAQSFPNEIAAIYEIQGMRHFTVTYQNTLITQALPLVLELLRAPINANHDLLTPYYNGIHIPRVHLDVTGLRSIQATLVDRDGAGTSADYTLDADGILVRMDPLDPLS